MRSEAVAIFDAAPHPVPFLRPRRRDTALTRFSAALVTLPPRIASIPLTIERPAVPPADPASTVSVREPRLSAAKATSTNPPPPRPPRPNCPLTPHLAPAFPPEVAAVFTAAASPVFS